MSKADLYHKTLQVFYIPIPCDTCIPQKCSLITESEFDSVENTSCTWICPKCDFFNFSDSFFADQLNLENGSGTKASQTGSDKNKFITGLKFVSININSVY